MADRKRKGSRRKKNTRKRVHGVMFPRRAVGLVVIIAFSALSYLWLFTRCDALGRELKGLEQEQTQLERKYLNEEYRWMRMKSPQNLEKTLARCGIDMTWPRRDQVVWLADAGDVVDISGESGRSGRRRERVADVRRGSRYD